MYVIRLRKALKAVLQILKKVRGYPRPEISLVTCASGMSSGAMQSTSHVHTELAGHTVTPNSGFRRSISLRKKMWCIFFCEMTRGRRRPVCIEIPIVMDYSKYSANFGGFSSLTPETSPYTPRANQHQKIH